MLIIRTI